jgi:hypothetical protein
VGFFAVGLLALAAGFFLPGERRAMFGIAIGCIPTGLLGTALCLYLPRLAAARRPEWLERKRDALDERDQHIRHSAGHFAFWALFLYVGLYTLLSPTSWLAGVSHTAFGVATLWVTMVFYWSALFVYRRKY